MIHRLKKISIHPTHWTCRQCHAPRSLGDATCPHCGARGIHKFCLPLGLHAQAMQQGVRA